MATAHIVVFLFLLINVIFFTIPPSTAEASTITALVAPITKDASTSLYTIPLEGNKPFVLDLAGPFLWSPCPAKHSVFPCNSTTCAIAGSSPQPHCPAATATRSYSCTCNASVVNPVTGACASGDLTKTNVTLSSTNGHNPISTVTIAGVVSACAPTTFLKSLPSGAAGVAGLARSGLSLPSQLASKLMFTKQFALCLQGTSNAPGVAFFGNGPFYVLPPPGVNLSTLLTYTTLLKTPANANYYLNVAGLAVNGDAVKLTPGALKLDSLGHGGVVISTTKPYTVFKSSIYQPFLAAFSKATSGFPKMAKMKPFDICFNSSALTSTRVGYGVPQIDLMLGGGQNWTIFGANSLVDVGTNTACFAFVDGGPKMEQAAVIGGFQMENNFLVFDVGRSRLGFSSLLFGIMTTCSNFNFTIAA